MPNKPEWTTEKLKEKVYDKKQKLVVLDNQILAIDDWEHFHPGGVFTLSKNYGRDITKYFNGSYKLVNIPNEVQYIHLADSRTIANSMVIANLEG